MVSDETMMTIHFNADLRPVVKENVGMLHWVMDPLVSGFIIGYDLSGNQVLICNFDVGLPTFLFYRNATSRLTYSMIVQEIPRGILERATLPQGTRCGHWHQSQVRCAQFSALDPEQKGSQYLPGWPRLPVSSLYIL